MDQIVKPSDIRDELIHYAKYGGAKRFYLGHKLIDNFYGIREASRTDWTGYPGSGKTELMLEALWNCANYYDHKHLICMPDAGSVSEIAAKLFHKVTGKRLERYYWTSEGRQEADNLATTKEIDRYLPEILHYFKILRNGSHYTPSQYWEYAEKHKEKLDIFSAVIDSFNHMTQDLDGLREDKWLAKTLQTGNDIVERSGLHFHTIIHPKSVRKVDGKIQPPSYHEMKGGSEWGNYAKSVIVVHWEKGSPKTEIHFDKIKGANIGIKGMCMLNYDIKAGKYYEAEIRDNVYIKNFAAPQGKEQPELKKMDAVQPNMDFYEVDKGDTLDFSKPHELDDDLPF